MAEEKQNKSDRVGEQQYNNQGLLMTIVTKLGYYQVTCCCKYVGNFKNLDDAIKAREKAEIEMKGEFRGKNYE